jgi:uncharacterized Zn finger protein (UPF0148 family)
VAEPKRQPAKPPGKRPGFLETLRAPVRTPGSAARPTGVGPKGKGGRRQPTSAGAASSNGASTIGTPVDQPELLREREQLSKQFAELQWDLGGIAYEMAARDHYRLDVLNKQAARLQEVDGKLGQIERLLKLGEAGAAGSCPSCGALQSRGAVFCWQCGNELRPKTTPEAPKAPTATTPEAPKTPAATTPEAPKAPPPAAPEAPKAPDQT